MVEVPHRPLLPSIPTKLSLCLFGPANLARALFGCKLLGSYDGAVWCAVRHIQRWRTSHPDPHCLEATDII